MRHVVRNPLPLPGLRLRDPARLLPPLGGGPGPAADLPDPGEHAEGVCTHEVEGQVACFLHATIATNIH
jgi:hypothetical protein